MGLQPSPREVTRERVVLGIVGGSGLRRMDEIRRAEPRTVETPFGAPSGPYWLGELPRSGAAPLRTVFLARHGEGHVLLPSEINYRANVHGFRQLGVTHLLGISAVGSLRDHLAPGQVVLPDQFIDRTHGRSSTFFGGGIVGHVQFGEPTCAEFRGRVAAAARSTGAVVQDRGTCVVIEGPAFSTRAEAQVHRGWGADVVGMTAIPEAKLAREAEMAYCMLALVTDYDCWRTDAPEVRADDVVAVIAANVTLAERIVLEVAQRLPEAANELPWPRACDGAVLTEPTTIPPSARERLALILGDRLEQEA